MTSNVQFNRRILEMEEVYIVSGVRTAIGKYGGSLKNVPAHTLAAEVIKEAVKRAGISYAGSQFRVSGDLAGRC